MIVKKRETSLAPETEYTLDGAVECSDIDAGTAGLMRLYVEQKQFDDALGDLRVDYTNYYGYRNGFRDALRALGAEIFAKAPRNEQIGACAVGLLHGRYQASQLAYHVATWSIADMVEGGCLQAWKTTIQSKDGLTPSPRNMRRLASPNWIRRRFKSDQDVINLRHLVSGVLTRLDRNLTPTEMRDASRDFDRMVLAQMDREREKEREFWRQQGLAERAYGDAEKSFCPGSKKKAERRRYRKVARKAASTAVAIVGSESVSRFVRGEYVRIPGQTIDFQVKRRALAASNGHGALDIAVHDKGTGDHLADLCLYFENTPALDQMTAIKLHLATGLEGELLETANVTRTTELGATHPVLVERKRVRDARAPVSPQVAELAAMIEGQTTTMATYEDRRKRDQDYWDAHKAIWLEVADIHILGRARRFMGPPSHSELAHY